MSFTDPRSGLNKKGIYDFQEEWRSKYESVVAQTDNLRGSQSRHSSVADAEGMEDDFIDWRLKYEALEKDNERLRQQLSSERRSRGLSPRGRGADPSSPENASGAASTSCNEEDLQNRLD